MLIQESTVHHTTHLALSNDLMKKANNTITILIDLNVSVHGGLHLEKGMTRGHQVGWLVWRISKKVLNNWGSFRWICVIKPSHAEGALMSSCCNLKAFECLVLTVLIAEYAAYTTLGQAHS